MPPRHCRKSSPHYSGRRGRPNRACRVHHGAAEVSRTALLSNGSIVVSTLRTDLQKSLLFRVAFSIIT